MAMTRALLIIAMLGIILAPASEGAYLVCFRDYCLAARVDAPIEWWWVDSYLQILMECTHGVYFYDTIPVQIHPTFAEWYYPWTLPANEQSCTIILANIYSRSAGQSFPVRRAAGWTWPPGVFLPVIMR